MQWVTNYNKDDVREFTGAFQEMSRKWKKSGKYNNTSEGWWVLRSTQSAT